MTWGWDGIRPSIHPEFSGGFWILRVTRSLHSLLRGFSIPFLRIPVIEGSMSLSPNRRSWPTGSFRHSNKSFLPSLKLTVSSHLKIHAILLPFFFRGGYSLPWIFDVADVGWETPPFFYQPRIVWTSKVISRNLPCVASPCIKGKLSQWDLIRINA